MTRPLAESLTSAIVDSIAEAIVALDPSGHVIAWNRRAEELYGWSQSEALGQHIRDLVLPLLSASAVDSVLHDVLSGDEWRGNVLAQRRDGSSFLAGSRLQPLRDDRGAIVGTVGLSSDVTASEGVRQAMEEAERLGRLATDSAPAVVAVARIHDDRNLEWLYLNEALSEYTGLSREELVRPGRPRLVHPDDVGEREGPDMLATLGAGETIDRPMRLRSASGEYRWFRVRIRPVLDDEGRLLLAALVGMDIQDQRDAEDEARQREHVLRRLGDAIPAMINMAVPDEVAGERTIFFNRRWVDYTGLTEEELFDEDRRLEVVAPEFRDRMPELRRRLGSTTHEPVTGLFRFRRHDGQYRWHQVIHQPIPDEEGNVRVFVTFAVDVHESHAAEEVNARLAAIVDSSNDPIVGKTLDRVVTSWNAAAERTYGFTAEEMIGKPIDIIVPEGSREKLIDAFERVRRGERVPPFEMQRYTKDGRIIEVTHSLSPVIDRAGNIVGTSAITHDVTEEKRLVAELQRANAAKDEFLGLVSHELRTPLTTIAGFARALVANPGLSESDRHEIHDDLLRNSTRLQSLVENLLVLARLEHDAVEVEPLLLHRLVPRTVDRFADRFPGRHITMDLPDRVPPIEGQVVWIEQVLENLLSNAEKYSPGDAPIDVSIACEDETVTLSVGDRGPGIAPGEEEAIFDVFVRGSTVHHMPGAGLGLAVCKRLVELQGGTITVGPNGDAGARFTVTFPVAGAQTPSGRSR